MSLLVPINGVDYIIPETNEVGWGGNLDDFFVAISAGTLQKDGGSFTLSAETDFGASFGLKSLYYKSRATNVASTGALRLANAETGIVWRNALNNADLALTVNASNALTFNGVALASASLASAHIFVGSAGGVATDVAMSGDISIDNTGATAIGSGKIVNAQVNASAAIAYSKLNLATSIVNADINASAAIARTKLAAGTAWKLLADDGSGVITEIGFGSSGQVLTSAGATTLPSFQNVAGTGTVNSGTQYQLAYYATSTNAVSGLTLITASRALASDANGLPVAQADGTTATELGYVHGVTSALQTQLNAKAPIASPTFTGVLTAPNAALTDTTNQIVLGTTRTVTITAPTPATSSRTWTLPDLTTSPTFAALEGTQTFSGSKTFSVDLSLSASKNGSLTFNVINSDNSHSGARAVLNLQVGGTSAGDPLINWYRTGDANAWYMGADNSVSNNMCLGYSSGTLPGDADSLIIKASNGAVAIKGTNTNDDATTGFVGETVLGNQTTLTNFPTSTQWGDLTSITLSAGDWLVWGIYNLVSNSGTTTECDIAITTATGNSTTGFINGLNNFVYRAASLTGSNAVTMTVPALRFSLTGSTVVYLKYAATWSTTAPQALGNIRALRIR